jgi:ABC-type glycerol-3-phosphate transport system substrate-binding protein
MLSATVLVAGMGTLASCGSSSSSPSKTTLTVWYSTDDPVESTWSKGLVPLFEAANPKIKINMRVFGLDDFNDKMQDALGSKTGPDLAYATPRAPAIPIYVAHGELANLTSYAKKYDWAGLMRPGLLSYWNVPFGVWQTKAPDLGGGDDDDDAPAPTATQIYGVPTAMSAVALAYNTKLMSKLGISFPTSVSQLAADAAKAKKAGMIPFGLGNNDLWLGDDWYIVLADPYFSFNQQESVLHDGSFNFDSAPFVQAGNQLAAWSRDGYFTPKQSTLYAQAGILSFFQGNTLFQLVSSSENAQILQDEKSTKMPMSVRAFPSPGAVDDGPPPLQGGVMPYSGYEGWVVPKSSAHKAADARWINFMLHHTATAYLLKHGVLPTTPVSVAMAPTVFQRQFLTAMSSAQRSVYLDAAPVPNFDASMEGNTSALLDGKESGTQVASSVADSYSSYGKRSNRVMDIDGEY